MKKVLSILFASFYLVLSIGLHGTVHKCMGTVTEWSWGHKDLSCHDEPHGHEHDTGEQESDCCNNNELELWLVADQLIQKEFFLPSLLPFALTGGCTVLPPHDALAERSGPIVPQAHKPPKRPLYIQYGDLRFYG